MDVMIDHIVFHEELNPYVFISGLVDGMTKNIEQNAASLIGMAEKVESLIQRHYNEVSDIAVLGFSIAFLDDQWEALFADADLPLLKKEDHLYRYGE